MSQAVGLDRSLVQRLVEYGRRIFNVHDGEGGALVWAWLYFFCLLACNYVLRPVRETMGIREGTGKLPWLFTGTLIATLVASPLFSALVSRFPRRRFIPYAYRFFAVTLLVFFALLSGPWLTEAARIRLGYAFYIWMSVFNLFVVSVFWGFLADCFSSEQGQRLFGFIALGGTLGAIAGAAAAKALADPVGPVRLLLIGAALLEAAVQCVRQLGRRFEHPSREPAAAPAEAELARGGSWGGIVRTVRSPYLLGIAGYTLLYALTSTLMNMEQSQLVYEQFATAGQRATFFARVDLYVNTGAIVVQALLSGRIVRAMGVGSAAALLPLAALAGFGAVAIWPVVGVMLWAQVARRATEYAVARPAREVFYTVVPRGDKYKAKSFIDTFVYRSADTLGAWVYAPVAGLAAGLAGVVIVAAPLALAWGTISLVLGRRQRQMAANLATRSS